MIDMNSPLDLPIFMDHLVFVRNLVDVERAFPAQR